MPMSELSPGGRAGCWSWMWAAQTASAKQSWRLCQKQVAGLLAQSWIKTQARTHTWRITMEPRPSIDSQEPGVPAWACRLGILLLIAGAIALLILLLRTWKRGGAAVMMAAALPAVASMATASSSQVQPTVNQRTLQRALEEIAAISPRVTPTELLEKLEACGEEFASVQEMGRVLRILGLQSQVGYVPGRTERRWYRLDRWRAHDSD